MPRRPVWLWIALGLWLAALAGLAGWLLLRGGGDPGGNVLAEASPQAEGPIPPAKALAPAAQLDLAFRTAFGASREARRAVGDQTYVYTPERIEWIGNKAMLISLGRNVDDCHVCGGTMAIHYLYPQGDGLSVSGAWLENPPAGSHGTPPGEVAIRRDLTNDLVVYATGGFTSQGYTCTVAWLVALRHEAPVTSGPIPISYSNAGAVEENGRTMGGDPLREIEGRIENIRRNRSFDVAFTGAERFSETYHYRGDRFVGPEESRATC